MAIKGSRQSLETKRKISESRRLFFLTSKGVFIKKCQSELMKNRIISEETKARMSIAKKGNDYKLGIKLSKEARNRISNGQQTLLASEKGIALRIKRSMFRKGKSPLVLKVATIQIKPKIYLG